MKSKILIGLVLGALGSPCLLMGSFDDAPAWVKKYQNKHKNKTHKAKKQKKQIPTPAKDKTLISYVTPTWVERYRVKGSDYKGAMWMAHKTNYNNNEVIINKAKGMGIFHGKYDFSKDKKIETPVLTKIVITQSNPCYVIPKNFGLTKNIRGKYIVNDIKKAVKLSKDTVEVYLGFGGENLITEIKSNIRFGLHNKEEATEENSIMILGKDLECLTESNEETWEVYWNLKNKWVLMAREKFYLKGE